MTERENLKTNDTVNIMKLLRMAAIVAFGLIGAQAFADDSASTSTDSKIAVEQYQYSTHLDVQRVISITDIADQCGPVPMQMKYEDSKGEQHILAYQVMGTGCSNG